MDSTLMTLKITRKLKKEAKNIGITMSKGIHSTSIHIEQKQSKLPNNYSGLKGIVKDNLLRE